MLLDFSFRNFFSFKEGVSISFRVNEKCPEDISQGKDYVTLMGIKGANGSGKTNILRAFSFIAELASRSFEREIDAELNAKQFFNSDKPSEFTIQFIVNDINYIYEIHVDNDRIYYESLFRNLKRKTKIFERVDNEIVFATKEYIKLKNINIRQNASVVSTAHNHKLELLDDVYEFFRNWIVNVGYKGFIESGPNIFKVAEALKNNPDMLESVKTFIVNCDGGVSDIVINEVVKEDGDKVFLPFFVHEVGGVSHQVPHVAESSGTKSLFKYLLMYYFILDAGGLLVLDEFDINLHPHILPKLLALFTDPEVNKNNAQMVFSTHNSDVLDFLGRYRCILVNKENNESYAYRLDEIPGDILRNDRPITPSYNRGDIGGVPRV